MPATNDDPKLQGSRPHSRAEQFQPSGSVDLKGIQNDALPPPSTSTLNRQDPDHVAGVGKARTRSADCAGHVFADPGACSDRHSACATNWRSSASPSIRAASLRRPSSNYGSADEKIRSWEMSGTLALNGSMRLTQPLFIKWFPRLIAVIAVLSILTVVGYAVSSL
jgi:hypothetical protein